MAEKEEPQLDYSDLMGRDDILNCPDLEEDVIVIPEWKGRKLRVRAATAAEWDEYENNQWETKQVGDQLKLVKNSVNHRGRLVSRCVISKDNQRIFFDEDVKKLGLKSTAAIDRVFNRILELSGKTEMAKKGLEGNSGAGQDGDSSSNSPAT